MAYQSQWKERSGEILAIAGQVREQHPDYWEALKIHGTPDRRYINAVSAACIAKLIPAGVNQKRGTQGDSIDAIALPNPTGVAAAVGPYPFVEIIDIVGGAEGGPGSTPTLVWGDVTQATIDKGEKGGWKAGTGSGEQPVPIPPPVPTYPTYEQLGGDSGGVAITMQLEADYKRAGRPGLDRSCGAWQQRVAYDFLTGVCKTVQESITKHRKEWCDALGIPVA